MAAPPILPANGKSWNFIVVNCDDATLDLYGSSPMPLFNANWASGYVDFPNGSCNTPLCLPGRAATLMGLRVERHTGWDNNSGANLNLNLTFLVEFQRHGYYTGAIGKWINGFGEGGGGGFGTATRQAGVDFQRIQWGAPNYFDWTELDENGDNTTDNTSTTTDRVHHTTDSRAAYTDVTHTDYATDVEADRVRQFLTNAAATGKPFCLYYAPKAPHQDSHGDPLPPARHAATSVTLTEDESFGVDPTLLGIPSWCATVGTSPWNAGAIAAARATHTESLRTVRALDEALHLIFTKLASLGMDTNTVIVLKTDNAHAGGELRLNDKGTPHRSSSSMLMRVKVPGQAGGTCKAAVSDIDVAPFLFRMAGIKPAVGRDGMSFHRCITDFDATHREAAPMSNPYKDSPTFAGLWFADGSVHYRIGDNSNKGAGQEGGWTDAAMTTNVDIAGAAAKLRAIIAAGPVLPPE